MTIERITRAASVLNFHRAKVASLEDALQREVAAFCDTYRGSARDMAKKLGVSVAYLCDIRHGRRKVSFNVVEKLRKLK
jgi:hypothetical protein